MWQTSLQRVGRRLTSFVPMSDAKLKSLVSSSQPFRVNDLPNTNINEARAIGVFE